MNYTHLDGTPRHSTSATAEEDPLQPCVKDAPRARRIQTWWGREFRMQGLAALPIRMRVFDQSALSATGLPTLALGRTGVAVPPPPPTWVHEMPGEEASGNRVRLGSRRMLETEAR